MARVECQTCGEWALKHLHQIITGPRTQQLLKDTISIILLLTSAQSILPVLTNVKELNTRVGTTELYRIFILAAMNSKLFNSFAVIFGSLSLFFQFGLKKCNHCTCTYIIIRAHNAIYNIKQRN